MPPSRPSAPSAPEASPASSAPGAPARARKIPESVLVVIHTPALQVLLLERADHPGFWQSVTGSKDTADEPLETTCRREVFEETGLDVTRYRLVDLQYTNRYEIYAHWRHRYADGVTHNLEHVFALEVPEALPITVAPREHLGYAWLPWEEAADRCFSWSNAQAIRELPRRVSNVPGSGASGAPGPGSGASGSGSGVSGPVSGVPGSGSGMAPAGTRAAGAGDQ